MARFTLFGHIKLKKLCKYLSIPRTAVVGHLELLWHSANTAVSALNDAACKRLKKAVEVEVKDGSIPAVPVAEAEERTKILKALCRERGLSYEISKVELTLMEWAWDASRARFRELAESASKEQPGGKTNSTNEPKNKLHTTAKETEPSRKTDMLSFGSPALRFGATPLDAPKKSCRFF